MPDDREQCSNVDCGCLLEVLATTRECPNCGGRLRLSGRSQLLQFRLTCPNCSYQSNLLSQEELQVLL